MVPPGPVLWEWAGCRGGWSPWCACIQLQGALWRLSAGTVASRHTVARADPWQGLRSTTDSTRARPVGVHLWGYKGQLQT